MTLDSKLIVTFYTVDELYFVKEVPTAWTKASPVLGLTIIDKINLTL